MKEKKIKKERKKRNPQRIIDIFARKFYDYYSRDLINYKGNWDRMGHFNLRNNWE